ncbi:HD domain-containing phosphohydrolase [Celerinatantimonas sp. MCCC 1A17872]|uniref:HD domain-containing phosphohydrolase n=1 Tax=Celerinatantimonas sp. MCCC 1A17872 TaxID=3177514 RepID=UPI0038CAACD0
MHKLKHIAFSMRVTVFSLFITLSVLIIAVALGLQYYFAQSMAHDAAKTQFTHVSEAVSKEIYTIDNRATAVLMLLSQYLETEKSTDSQAKRNLVKMMMQAMRQVPFLYAMYMGYPNGEFYELVNLDSSDIARHQLDANDDDRWVIIHIHATAKGRIRERFYYDSDFKLNHQKSDDSHYYANVRPWYTNALAKDIVIKTAPYLFNNTQSPGVTYAKRIPGTQNVIAADISLNTLGHYLQNNRVDNHAETILFNRDGNTITSSLKLAEQAAFIKVKPIPLSDEEKNYIHSLGKLIVSSELNWPPFDFSSNGTPQGYSVDMVKLLAKKVGLKIIFSNGYNWSQLTSLFKEQNIDILHSIINTPDRKSWGLYTKPYIKLTTAIAVLTHEKNITSLKELNGKTVAIPKGWALVELVKKNYPKINILEVKDSMDELLALQDKHADAAIDTTQVLRYLTDIHEINDVNIYELPNEHILNTNQNLSILVHQNQQQLRRILDKAIAAITTQERAYLKAKWLDESSTSKIKRALWAGVVPHTIFTKLTKQLSATSPNVITEGISIDNKDYTIYVHQMKANLGEQNYIGIMIPTADIQRPYMVKVYVSLLLTLSLLILMSPILIYFSRMIVQPVKQLSIQNSHIKHREFNALKRVKSHITEINELSNSLHNMTISIAKHQEQQQKLLDSFIQLIAQAIDDKSPYTGKHCARVPDLAIMLAQAANHSDLPGFKDFDFDDKSKQYEFKISAWLHDCGKITTPEHIIDKGTKLETIYNRIHEIRTRFEVLWRDAQIDYWKGRAKGKSEILLDTLLEEKQAQIQDDFAFIAQCNVGSEHMDEAKIARIHQIASITWTRYFDDRLGLSPLEAKEAAKYPSADLPATEYLLANKPQHKFKWLHNPKYKMSDEIKMSIPTLSANIGEIYNLSIIRGTLTTEDRFRINEHIIATISMLESLPLPKELARVPDIAGGHHETLIGTGYPRALSAEDLPIEARILAVADVFEALTAADRPYKKAKTLSEALDILAQMVNEQQLDPDVFKLLLQSGVYKKYADKFLDPAQYDECDINKYL